MIPEALVPKDWPGLLGWLRRLRQAVAELFARIEKIEKKLEEEE